MSRETPTQSRLIELKEQLEFAKDGYDLLERKREVLISELMSHIQELKSVRKEFIDDLTEGLKHFREAYVEMGEINMELALHSEPQSPEINSIERSVMGVIINELSSVEVNTIEKPGLEVGNPQFNKSITRAQEAFKSLTKYVEKYDSVWKIAIEIKKTLRRVNALDNIFIPQYKETIKWIEESLEEEEREQFVRQKKVKKKLEAE